MLSTKVIEKSAGKMRSMQLVTIILLTAIAIFFTMDGSAMAKGWKKEKAKELDPVNVFIEWNSTDMDQGLQFFWDSDGFTRMIVFNERGKKVLDIETKNSVKDQGLTEVAIESVEPDESEQTLPEFLERFPAGTYKFWGRSIDNGWLYGEAELTHNLLRPADLNLDDFPEIKWTEYGMVTKVEVVVEAVIIEKEDDELAYKQTTTLQPGIEMLTVSEEFIEMIAEARSNGDLLELKVEILVDEESGNRTITEEVLFEAED